MAEPIHPDVCIPLRPYERVSVSSEGVFRLIHESFGFSEWRLRPKGSNPLFAMCQVEVVNWKSVKKLELYK